MQSERWYLLDHPEYIENSVVVGRYGGANTRLVNVYVSKKMVYHRLFKYNHSLLQGILTMYPRLLQHHGRKNTRGQGTGESCRKGVRVICVCPANKGKSKTKVERAFPRRVCLMLHARLVIACTPMKTT